MAINFSSLANFFSDMRVIILVFVMVIGTVFWAGWEARPIMSGYENVSEVQTIAKQNDREIKQNDDQLSKHETEITTFRDRIETIKQEQQSTARAVENLNRTFKIFACTQDDVSAQTYARLNCSDFD